MIAARELTRGLTESDNSFHAARAGREVDKGERATS
jgi:hypothetical protein